MAKAAILEKNVIVTDKFISPKMWIIYRRLHSCYYTSEHRSPEVRAHSARATAKQKQAKSLIVCLKKQVAKEIGKRRHHQELGTEAHCRTYRTPE